MIASSALKTYFSGLQARLVAAAEALGRDAGVDALASGIDRRRGAGGAATDHENVEGVLGLDLLGHAIDGAGVQLGQDLFQVQGRGRDAARKRACA